VVGPDPKPTSIDDVVGSYLQVEGLTRAYTLFEAGGLSPLHVAATFVAGRRDYADMASRVPTRRDVNWRPLLPDRVEPKQVPPLFPVLVHETHALSGDAIASAAASSDSQSF
jgi:hypothetical protein